MTHSYLHDCKNRCNLRLLIVSKLERVAGGTRAVYAAEIAIVLRKSSRPVCGFHRSEI